MRTTRDPPGSVAAYASVVAVVGFLIGIVVVVVEAPKVPWLSWHAMATSYMLAALLFIGELRPLEVRRSDGEADKITVSSTFAVALILIGPLSLALFAQGLAVVVDDVLRRRSLAKAAFNVGQYAITLTAARGAFCLTTGIPLTAPPAPLAPGVLWAALLAAAVYFLVNNALVAGIEARETGRRTLTILASDLRVQAMASSIALGLAPVAAVAANYSLWMLLLMLLPLVGVQQTTWIAGRRHHEALHDELTSLPNRVLFHRFAKSAIANGLQTGHRVGVMLLDLDHFKEVNDTLGHHVGDGLLRQVAGRLTTGVPDGVVVARLGGDEFAVLVPEADSVRDVVRLAELLSVRLQEPVLADGVRVSVQASVGIAVRPDHGDDVDTLLRRAEIALYRAKDERGQVQVYRTEIDQHTIRRLSLLGDLHGAVENDEFVLVYQPQVDAASGKVVAIEALMRWRHPSHGTLSPDQFIPLAENTGAIAPMSRAAMGKALTMVAELRRAGHDVAVAVNLSARLLSDIVLPTWVERMLAASEVPASRLTIEVTESTITADPRRAMDVLQRLRAIGVRLSIDDFGIGYSSLAYLRRLCPDELKVDKSFVLTMREDDNSSVIVRSTIDLAHGLGLSVVAEGVEDQWTYDALETLGADRIQGYHVARPMTPMALSHWMDVERIPRIVLPR